MGKVSIVATAVLLVAACKEKHDLLTDGADASVGGIGGAGGTGGAACQFDDWRIAMAGAVHEDPQVPRPGSWCPRDGIEICTEVNQLPDAPATGDAAVATPGDAGPSGPFGVVSRCVGHAWQTATGERCETTRVNCNVFNYREYDGQCCVNRRNCEDAFCDGERWWTRRE